jgi:hypothetical protein
VGENATLVRVCKLLGNDQTVETHGATSPPVLFPIVAAVAVCAVPPRHSVTGCS